MPYHLCKEIDFEREEWGLGGLWQEYDKREEMARSWKGSQETIVRKVEMLDIGFSLLNERVNQAWSQLETKTHS